MSYSGTCRVVTDRVPVIIRAHVLVVRYGLRLVIKYLHWVLAYKCLEVRFYQKVELLKSVKVGSALGARTCNVGPNAPARLGGESQWVS